VQREPATGAEVLVDAQSRAQASMAISSWASKRGSLVLEHDYACSMLLTARRRVKVPR